MRDMAIKGAGVHVKNKIRTVILIILLAFIVIIATMRLIKKEIPMSVSIFSWHWEEMQAEEWKPLLQVMDRLGVQEVYQDFDMEQSSEMRKDFWELLKEKNYKAYYLCGDPKWAYPSRWERVLQAIEEAALLAEESQGTLKGIVFDVEPYTMEEWEEEEEAGRLMKDYAATMKKAYDEAAGYGLEVILCIPNFFDDEYGEELETLIRDCCDGIAVMNYSKDGQIERIRAEAELAYQYDKVLIHISEVQKGDASEVTRQMQETRTLWNSIRREYPDGKLKFSYHHLGALTDVYAEDKDYE